MPWLSIWIIAPFDALAVEGEGAGGDEAHVRDRRIGDQLLHVGLRSATSEV
jgi:hypothetical protein